VTPSQVSPDAFRGVTLTQNQAGLLCLLIEAGGLKLAQIVERLAISEAATRERLKGLQRRALVEQRAGRTWHATARSGSPSRAHSLPCRKSPTRP